MHRPHSPVTHGALALALLVVACIKLPIEDPDCHSGNGDATCEQIFGGEKPYCVNQDSECREDHEFGCVSELPAVEDCHSPCGEDDNCQIAEGTDSGDSSSGPGDGDGDPGDGDGEPGDGDPGDGDPGDVCDPNEVCSDTELHTGQLQPPCVPHTNETNTVTADNGLNIATAINNLNNIDTDPTSFHHLIIHPKPDSAPYTESPIEATNNMVIEGITIGTDRVTWQVQDSSPSLTLEPGVTVYLVNVNLSNSIGGAIALQGEDDDRSAIHIDRSMITGNNFALVLNSHTDAYATSSFLTSTGEGNTYTIYAFGTSNTALNHSTIYSNHAYAVLCTPSEGDPALPIVQTTGFSTFAYQGVSGPTRDCDIVGGMEHLSVNSNQAFPFTGLTDTGDLHIDWSMHLDEPSLIAPPHTPPSCDIDTDPFPTEDIRFGADQP